MKLDALLTNLGSIFDSDDEIQITKSNLVKPSAEFARKIYSRLLLEIGITVSSNIPSDILLHHSAEEESLLRLFWYDDVLVLCMQKFCNDVSFKSDPPFGILDVVNPELKRFKEFLVALVNFWNFCNANFSKYRMIKDEADQRKIKEKELMKEKERLTEEVNALRRAQEADRFMNEKYLAEKDDLSKQLKGIWDKTNQLNIEGLKRELNDARKVSDDLKQLIVETEEQNLAKEKRLNMRTEINKITNNIKEISLKIAEKKHLEIEERKVLEENKQCLVALEALKGALKKVVEIMENIKELECKVREVSNADDYLKTEIEDLNFKSEDLKMMIKKSNDETYESNSKEKEMIEFKKIELDECEKLIASMDISNEIEEKRINDLEKSLEKYREDIRLNERLIEKDRSMFQDAYAKLTEGFASLLAKANLSLQRLDESYQKFNA